MRFRPTHAFSGHNQQFEEWIRNGQLYQNNNDDRTVVAFEIADVTRRIANRDAAPLEAVRFDRLIYLKCRSCAFTITMNAFRKNAYDIDPFLPTVNTMLYMYLDENAPKANTEQFKVKMFPTNHFFKTFRKYGTDKPKKECHRAFSYIVRG